MGRILVCLPALVKDKVPRMNVFSTNFPHSAFGSGEATAPEAKGFCPGRVSGQLAVASGKAFPVWVAVPWGKLDDQGPVAFEWKFVSPLGMER